MRKIQRRDAVNIQMRQDLRDGTHTRVFIFIGMVPNTEFLKVESVAVCVR